MRNPEEFISLFVLSDIHRRFVLNSFSEHRYEIIDKETTDFIINCGDLSFHDHSGRVMVDIALQEQLFSDIISEIDICNIPHFYVPGNHDPASTYEHSTPAILPEPHANTTNLHNYCYNIRNNLWLVGFGGSTPRLLDGHFDKEGYPYVNSDMGDEITQLVSLIPKGDQIILITHCPPANVGSSFVDCDSNGLLYTLGSQSMYNQVTELMKNYEMILLLHGHIHHEPATNWIHRKNRHCCIVNPGSLTRGRFAKVILKKKKGLWNVFSIDHHLSYE